MTKKNESESPEEMLEVEPGVEIGESEDSFSGEFLVPNRKLHKIALEKTLPRSYRRKGDEGGRRSQSISRFVVTRKWVSTRGAKRKGSV